MNYETNYVWQMQIKESERSMRIVFDRVRLPRLMEVDLPYDLKAVDYLFEKADYVYLICYQEQILGYVCLSLNADSSVLSVDHFLIHHQVRQQGIGSLLMKTIKQIASHHHCRRLRFMAQTKNNPAIMFVQKQGFIYSGYDDQYYGNGDIALIFSFII